MYSFGFVVLHYKTYEETKETIDSILCLPTEGRTVKIVVVDNASENGSTEKLIRDYKDREHVSFIINKENLGFSGGNNVGFRELKKQGYDFIILSNNDIVVKSPDFYNKVEEDYEKYGFAVLGPAIENPDNGHTGCRTLPPDLKFAKGRIFRLYLKYYLGNLYSAYERFRSKDTPGTQKENDETYSCGWKNVTLHGCFLIFSRDYIKKFKGLAHLTFMYAEEEILFIRLMKSGLISIYDPEIRIFHKEGAATALSGKKMTKESFIRHIKAQKVLVKLIKKYLFVENIRGEKL